ncbi:MAG: hypothetical protein HKN82_13865 [Akkermansiaceae bacterium]|nr:hypothetical protein [Akkermansiaceae bacterium]NNM28941.1 hypothetical protein [Akkermansiaceae bacterium]
MNATPDLTTNPRGFAEWLAEASSQAPRHSIVIASKCPADIVTVGGAIAGYLNEFDDSEGGAWRAFDATDLRHLAGDPECRTLLLDSLPKDPGLPDPCSDLDRIIRRLGLLGGAVLEGQASLDAAAGLRNTFQICLCCTEHADPEHCHMWLNPQRFSRESLVAIIADSFLDWASRLDG